MLSTLFCETANQNSISKALISPHFLSFLPSVSWPGLLATYCLGEILNSANSEQGCAMCLCQLLWHVHDGRGKHRTQCKTGQQTARQGQQCLCGPGHSRRHTQPQLAGTRVYVLAMFFSSFLIGNKLIPFNELKNIVYLWFPASCSNCVCDSQLFLSPAAAIGI